MSEGRSRSLADMGKAMAEQVIDEGRQAEFRDVVEKVEYIDITPVFDDRLYSPHVLTLKLFFEKLSRLNARTDGSGAGWWELVEHVQAELPTIRKAMGNVLADDMFLLTDGKREVGKAVGDR